MTKKIDMDGLVNERRNAVGAAKTPDDRRAAVTRFRELLREEHPRLAKRDHFRQYAASLCGLVNRAPEIPGAENYYITGEMRDAAEYAFYRFGAEAQAFFGETYREVLHIARDTEHKELPDMIYSDHAAPMLENGLYGIASPSEIREAMVSASLEALKHEVSRQRSSTNEGVMYLSLALTGDRDGPSHPFPRLNRPSGKGDPLSSDGEEFPILALVTALRAQSIPVTADMRKIDALAESCRLETAANLLRCVIPWPL